MFGVFSGFMHFVYMALTLLVPLIALFQTWQYRKWIGGSIGFFHAWQFGVLLYFFAGLIVSLEHYLFFRHIAPSDFLAESLKATMDMLANANIDQKILDSIGNMNISPIRMAVQGILNNVFYGVIFSLPVAWIISRLKETVVLPPEATDKNS
jgi:hypothetical protein